jgi:hypothetical protein
LDSLVAVGGGDHVDVRTARGKGKS